MSGADGYNASGVYGTQGVASAGNVPGAREGAAGWTDSSGNFWLFGGVGYDATGASGWLDDLWKLNATTEEWTWVGGSSNSVNQAGVYGATGAASAANTPGARYGAVSWTDSSGNLWLFGGAGIGANGTSGAFNDLWKFSPANNEWTWEGGSDLAGASGVYGTQGVAAAGNTPGARAGAVGWTDSSGDFWLFGGGGYDSTGSQGALNDLWEFSPAKREWTWVSGLDAVNPQGVYGMEGTASANNVPGGRSYAVTWTGSTGNLWLFGGGGYDSTDSQGILNDLWEFNTATHEWTWAGGSHLANASGVYGTQGVTAAGNTPGAREGAVGWTDSSGNFWLFGGVCFDASNPPLDSGDTNDLWEFSAASSEWTWVRGPMFAADTPSPQGVYGKKGTASASNVPGGRSRAVGWVDANGNLWLLGGEGLDFGDLPGNLNDLWRYQP